MSLDWNVWKRETVKRIEECPSENRQGLLFMASYQLCCRLTDDRTVDPEWIKEAWREIYMAAARAGMRDAQMIG